MFNFVLNLLCCWNAKIRSVKKQIFITAFPLTHTIVYGLKKILWERYCPKFNCHISYKNIDLQMWHLKTSVGEGSGNSLCIRFATTDQGPNL